MVLSQYNKKEGNDRVFGSLKYLEYGKNWIEEIMGGGITHY